MGLDWPHFSKVEEEAMEWNPQGQRRRRKPRRSRRIVGEEVCCWEDMGRN
jgi:hypothetical protein